MVTTWEIILAVIIVGLSIVMPIYYSYQRKKNPKQDNKPSDNPEIKNYIDKINEITRNKHKWKSVYQVAVNVGMKPLF